MPSAASQKNKILLAKSVTRSWLRACQLPYVETQGFTLLDSTGAEVTVGFTQGEPYIEDIALSVDSMAHPRKDVVLTEFHTLTELLGHGKPIPVDRGEAVNISKDRGSESAVFLAVCKHREFHLAPDLQPHKYHQYKRVVNVATQRFVNKNWKLMVDSAYDKEDLEAFCWIWITIYVHKYEVQYPINDDNNRLASKYLTDRFSALFLALIRLSGRNNVVRQEDDAKAALAFDVGAKHQIDAYEIELDVEEPEYEPMEAHVAHGLLLQKLSKLPHATYVQKLWDTSLSWTDDSTKKYARRLLVTHAKTCDECISHGDTFLALPFQRFLLPTKLPKSISQRSNENHSIVYSWGRTESL